MWTGKNACPPAAQDRIVCAARREWSQLESAEQRKAPNSDARFGHGNHGAMAEIILAHFRDLAEKFCKSFRPQSFDADSDDGGARCAGQR
jgi:hypothetical protein